MSLGEGLAGRVWESGEPLVIEDYDSWEGRQDTFPRGRIRALVGVPLLSGTEVIGTLGVARDALRRAPVRALRGRAAAALRAARVDRARQRAALRLGAGGPRARRRRECRQEHVPGRDEPRDPHADERGHRHERAAAAQRARRGAARVGDDHPHEQRGAADDHQRHPRLLEDRGRADGARDGAVRPARVRRRRRRADPHAGRREGPDDRAADRRRHPGHAHGRRQPAAPDPAQRAQQRGQVHGARRCHAERGE